MVLFSLVTGALASMIEDSSAEGTPEWLPSGGLYEVKSQMGSSILLGTGDLPGDHILPKTIELEEPLSKYLPSQGLNEYIPHNGDSKHVEGMIGALYLENDNSQGFGIERSRNEFTKTIERVRFLLCERIIPQLIEFSILPEDWNGSGIKELIALCQTVPTQDSQWLVSFQERKFPEFDAYAGAVNRLFSDHSMCPISVRY